MWQCSTRVWTQVWQDSSCQHKNKHSLQRQMPSTRKCWTVKASIGKRNSRSSYLCRTTSGRRNCSKEPQLNEQAAHAMSVQKSAHLQAQSQDQRIKELTAELHQVRPSAGQLNQTFQQTSSDLQAANVQMTTYIKRRNLQTFNAKT